MGNPRKGLILSVVNPEGLWEVISPFNPSSLWMAVGRRASLNFPLLPSVRKLSSLPRLELKYACDSWIYLLPRVNQTQRSFPRRTRRSYVQGELR